MLQKKKKNHRISTSHWLLEIARKIDRFPITHPLPLFLWKQKRKTIRNYWNCCPYLPLSFCTVCPWETVTQSFLFSRPRPLKAWSWGKSPDVAGFSCVVIVLSRPSVLGDMEGTVERPCKYIFSAALTLVWGGFEKLKCCTYHISPACRDPKLVGGTIYSTFLFVVPRGLRIDWLRNWGTRIFQLPFWTKSRNFFLSFIECVIQKSWLLGSLYF